eukprot:12420843-Karenia_brevis.AAC.1
MGRDISLLKGLQDSRPISAAISLEEEAKAVRNAITVKKSPDERVAILEDAIKKRRKLLPPQLNSLALQINLFKI